MLAGLLKGLLDWATGLLIRLSTWVFGLILTQIKRAEARKLMDEKAKQSVQPLKDAKTKEEIDNASNSALDGF